MKTSLLLAIFSGVVTSSSAFLVPQPRVVVAAASAPSSTSKLVGHAAAAPASTPTTSFVGSTLTDMDLAHEAAAKFFNEVDGIQFKQTSGGVNNCGFYCTLKDGRHFVLRVYNNGNNRARVHYEHTILNQLNQQQLSFAVPKPLPTLENPGMTYAQLSNGADACVFETIPGHLPKLTCVKDIGRAAGELLDAIQKVDVSHLACPTPPYSDFYAVHHAIDRESFYREMAGPAFDGVRESATKAVKYIEQMEEKLLTFEEKNLPKCLSHLDLHYGELHAMRCKAAVAHFFFFLFLLTPSSFFSIPIHPTQTTSWCKTERSPACSILNLRPSITGPWNWRCAYPSTPGSPRPRNSFLTSSRDISCTRTSRTKRLLWCRRLSTCAS